LCKILVRLELVKTVAFSNISEKSRFSITVSSLLLANRSSLPLESLDVEFIFLDRNSAADDSGRRTTFL
jgi:hypothetical protein